MNVKIDLNQIIGLVQGALAMLVKLALLIVLVVMTARYFHAGGALVTPPNTTEMAYLCGAWWLWSKS